MINDNVILPYPQFTYNMTMGMFQLSEDYVTPEFVVPKHTFTDGATVPDYLELFVHKFDRHLPAAVVHDWMYALGIGTKKEADDLFERNLWRCHYAYGFDADKIGPMVAAVRVFGKGNFMKKVNV